MRDRSRTPQGLHPELNRHMPLESRFRDACDATIEFEHPCGKLELVLRDLTPTRVFWSVDCDGTDLAGMMSG
jgi:hypothetical protein